MQKQVKLRLIVYLLIIGFFASVIRLLMEYKFHQSGLLYIGVPYLVAIALLWIRPNNPNNNWLKRYLILVINSLIVMLGSSLILMEGFLCVVMFMPIYFGVILVIFMFDALRRYLAKSNKNTLACHILPILLLATSLEGVTPNLSFDRQQTVSVTKVINADINAIKLQLLQPMNLNQTRPWFLSLFPMPIHIQAGTLTAGDIHSVEMVYHRWFVTNTHSGIMQVKLAKVTDTQIETQIIKDTSYISQYMQLQGSHIDMQPLNAKQTQITLMVNYKRQLDPAWYFQPMQQAAVKQMAELLIDHLMTPNFVNTRQNTKNIHEDKAHG